MLTLDGREGEGGGQVLRSALSLSLITGTPFRLEHVRAKRRPAGLRAQHLACVLGAAKLGDAEVEGAAVGSHTVTFRPRGVRPGDFELDVGTAGSTSLLAQCLAYPLALAGGGTLVLRGGTHVSHSPPTEYLVHVWGPVLALYGLSVEVRLLAAGFFPEGGGRIRVRADAPRRSGGSTLAWPPVVLRQVRVVSGVGGLPRHIAERQAAAAAQALTSQGLAVTEEVVEYPSPHSRGSSVQLVATGEAGLPVGASALGARGKPAEVVGLEGARELLTLMAQPASVDVHQADQLLLPATLAAVGLLGAKKATTYVAPVITDHLTTHARVLEQFLAVAIRVEDRHVTVTAR